MKKVVLIGATLSALVTGPATAADMARPVYKAAPAAPVSYTWTGCYIGGDVGGYQARQSGTTVAFPSPGFGVPAIDGIGVPGYGVLPTRHGLSRNGIIVGGYAGCNYQWGKTVLGVEGDFSWLNRSSSDAEPVTGSFTGVGAFPVAGTNMQLNASNHWLASVRGRLGWALGPSDDWLVYGTGGVAFTQTNYSAVFTPSTNPASLFGFGCPAGPVCFAQSSVALSQQQIGLVVGGGVEWRIAPNWLVRAEYLHYGFGGASGFVPAVLASGAPACAGCRWNANWNTLHIDTVRVGLSYKL